jgi:hypothetical protein
MLRRDYNPHTSRACGRSSVARHPFVVSLADRTRAIALHLNLKSFNIARG